MLENILNVKGAKMLTKSDQKQILGGFPGLIPCCNPELQCCTIDSGSIWPDPGCTFIHSNPITGECI